MQVQKLATSKCISLAHQGSYLPSFSSFSPHIHKHILLGLCMTDNFDIHSNTICTHESCRSSAREQSQPFPTPQYLPRPPSDKILASHAIRHMQSSATQVSQIISLIELLDEHKYLVPDDARTCRNFNSNQTVLCRCLTRQRFSISPTFLPRINSLFSFSKLSTNSDPSWC
jgi:hypothetical protein